MAKLSALGRLLRLSLAPSVLADVAVGASWAGASFASWPAVLLVASAAFLLFAGGMALNALVDLEEDRRTRPDRPLPAGEISVGSVRAIVVVGLIGAPGLLWLGERPVAALWAGGMALAIAAYHSPLKQNPLLGPILLGSVRGADLCLGAIAFAGWSGGAAAAGAGIAYATYVAAASVVAHHEDRQARTHWVRGAIGVALSVALAGPLLAAWISAPNSLTGLGLTIGGIIALVHLFEVRFVASLRTGELTPPRVGRAAGTLLSRMVFIPLALAGIVGQWWAVAAALIAFAAIRLLVRWIPPT